MKNNYFHSEPDHRTPYTIVIPPPNVTGVLHGAYVKQYDSRCLDKKHVSRDLMPAGFPVLIMLL
jgi:hypothetical protein